ncbi:unnamed protein product [Scytosiphon promiscuus]
MSAPKVFPNDDTKNLASFHNQSGCLFRARAAAASKAFGNDRTIWVEGSVAVQMVYAAYDSCRFWICGKFVTIKLLGGSAKHHPSSSRRVAQSRRPLVWVVAFLLKDEAMLHNQHGVGMSRCQVAVRLDILT